MCRAELLTWQWDSEVSRRFQSSGDESEDDCGCHFLHVATSHGSVVFVSRKPAVIEIDCYQVRRELSDYLEGDLTPQLRHRIEEHLKGCDHCRAVYDGLRNIMRLLGDEEVIELPEGFTQRLYKRLLPVY